MRGQLKSLSKIEVLKPKTVSLIEELIQEYVTNSVNCRKYKAEREGLMDEGMKMSTTH